MQNCQYHYKVETILFCEQIDETKWNPKGILNALKNQTGWGKRTTKIVELETENGTVYDESSVANELNDFFTKILEQLGKDDYSSDGLWWLKTEEVYFIQGLGPLQVLSYLKLNRSRLVISLVRPRSARLPEMMVWVPKSSTLLHHHLSTHFAGFWTYQLQQISSLINGKSAKLHYCTKVVSNVKEITIAPYQCCQSHLKSSKNM